MSGQIVSAGIFGEGFLVTQAFQLFLDRYWTGHRRIARMLGYNITLLILLSWCDEEADAKSPLPTREHLHNCVPHIPLNTALKYLKSKRCRTVLLKGIL